MENTFDINSFDKEQGCLFGLAKEGKFNFKQANELFSKKALPKKYKDSISLYLKENS